MPNGEVHPNEVEVEPTEYADKFMEEADQALASNPLKERPKCPVCRRPMLGPVDMEWRKGAYSCVALDHYATTDEFFTYSWPEKNPENYVRFFDALREIPVTDKVAIKALCDNWDRQGSASSGA